ncbi:MAG: hypothetical protein K0R65_1635 [Crocinitomicaceae bacterium]|jgi:hypothetical protein|nr:hypothetical protein [Crocinitomicaceae bacterium]
MYMDNITLMIVVGVCAIVPVVVVVFYKKKK